MLPSSSDLYELADTAPQEKLSFWSYRKGFGNKETVHVDPIIGTDYNSGEETDWIKIHYSKKRIHIVSYKPKG